MLLRLILALMLALGGPAMPAAGHEGMEPMALAGHRMPDPQPKAPMAQQHLCIGCVPIGDWYAVRVRPPVSLPAPEPISRIVALRMMPGKAPIPPPPRNG
ncbi:hypothetical protein [Sphingomonas asaccharolytica]|uniref:hypothetical protein n=1 Tax=Sphingomonas asaccharolytica TaxID=40681 RepID=UPI00082C2340|nr:hypothetical protein [Sphingomonas asaccharolytica]